MNTPRQKKSEEADLLSFLERVSRYQDGLLTAAEALELADEINTNSARREEFIQWQIRSAAIYDIESRGSVREVISSDLFGTGSLKLSGIRPAFLRKKFFRTGVTLLVVLLIVGTAWVGLTVSRLAPSISPPDRMAASPAAAPPKTSRALLAEEVNARFVGKDSLQAGSFLIPHRNYFLTDGLIKLVFSSGATAIIEAPAMFHLHEENCLALEIGSCSVHTPNGAEGFRVMTPVTEVVDRGTRFSVSVNDNNDTEVHVVEGAADLYPLAEFDSSSRQSVSTDRSRETGDPIRLQDHQAIRVGAFKNDVYESTPFHSEDYRRQLPDRIVRYQATQVDGLADELLNVTVQRGGQQKTYSVDALIPIEVIWFQGEAEPERSGHLAGDPNRPLRPQEWMEDRKLHTGFMNLGGQAQPLDHDPIQAVSPTGTLDGAPGLGVRFRLPVVNRPGPDVVLFDVQHFLQTLEGDPFHVSPVHFRPGLKTWTVHRFDLTVNSPESLVVLPFWRHKYAQPIRSLAELGTMTSQSNLRSTPIPVQAIAVGIDLSNLGFAEGEEVEELFFQHALKKQLSQPSFMQTGIPSKIDPVFIAGLPE